jgi:flagella basal body P-ring formation protein FlgA
MAFQVSGNNPETGTPILSVGFVPFSVKAEAIVSKRRILPGAPLQKEDFVVQKVDVTTGFLAEVRGLFLNKDEPVQGLEARNTLLEGQPVLVNAVQRIPALKRGEPVRLKVLSGTVALVTDGIADEPGHINQKIRVISRLTKRTLVGRLVEGGTVEVEL